MASVIVRPDQLSCAQMMALDTLARTFDRDTFARIAKETASITEVERIIFFSISEFLEDPTWSTKVPYSDGTPGAFDFFIIRSSRHMKKERDDLFDNLPILHSNSRPNLLVLKRSERSNATKVKGYAAALRQWAFKSEIKTIRDQLYKIVVQKRSFQNNRVLCRLLRGAHVCFDELSWADEFYSPSLSRYARECVLIESFMSFYRWRDDEARTYSKWEEMRDHKRSKHPELQLELDKHPFVRGTYVFPRCLFSS